MPDDLVIEPFPSGKSRGNIAADFLRQNRANLMSPEYQARVEALLRAALAPFGDIKITVRITARETFRVRVLWGGYLLLFADQAPFKPADKYVDDLLLKSDDRLVAQYQYSFGKTAAKTFRRKAA